MVLLDSQHVVWIFVDLWIHHDDAATIYQLQIEERRASSMAYAVVQIPEYVHRWYLCICDKDADTVQDRLLPRRYCFLHIFVPKMDIQDRSHPGERVRFLWRDGGAVGGEQETDSCKGLSERRIGEEERIILDVHRFSIKYVIFYVVPRINKMSDTKGI